MIILAIDPGTSESGFCFYACGETERTALRSGVDVNEALLQLIHSTNAHLLAIEMIASYGMPVGREVFETCVWIGRYLERWVASGKSLSDTRLIYRKDVKSHLCGSQKAKDSHIRRRLIDLIGAPGTKKQPGPTYGVKSHAWPALAVAVTAAETVAPAG